MLVVLEGDIEVVIVIPFISKMFWRADSDYALTETYSRVEVFKARDI